MDLFNFTNRRLLIKIDMAPSYEEMKEPTGYTTKCTDFYLN